MVTNQHIHNGARTYWQPYKRRTDYDKDVVIEKDPVPLLEDSDANNEEHFQDNPKFKDSFVAGSIEESTTNPEEDNFEDTMF